MSSSDGDGSVFSQFLNAGDSVTVNGRTIPLVNAANPLEWGRLGTTIVASLIGGVVLGIQRGIDAVLSLPVTLFHGAKNWVYDGADVFRFPGGRRVIEGETGLIPAVRDGLLGVIDAAWTPFTGLGWLSYPVIIASLLASLYVVVWALNYSTEEVL